MLTFLSKLGALIIKGASIVSSFAPVAELGLPGKAGIIQVVSKDFTEFANLIVTAEVLGQAKNIPGPDRAAFIAAQVEQLILQTSVMAGKKIANPALLRQGCQELAGGMADVLNSVHEDAAEQTKLT